MEGHRQKVREALNDQGAVRNLDDFYELYNKFNTLVNNQDNLVLDLHTAARRQDKHDSDSGTINKLLAMLRCFSEFPELFFGSNETAGNLFPRYASEDMYPSKTQQITVLRSGVQTDSIYIYMQVVHRNLIDLDNNLRNNFLKPNEIIDRLHTFMSILIQCAQFLDKPFLGDKL